MVQDIIYEDVLLHVCRLTDDPTVGRRNRQTLSVRQLPPLITDSTLRRQVRQKVSAAIKSSNFARDWRDRHIAHRDLKLALRDGVEPLAGASRALVKTAIEAITQVLADVEEHYCETTTAYEHGIGPLCGAEALLYLLRDGLEARDELNRKMKAGEYDAIASFNRGPI